MMRQSKRGDIQPPNTPTLQHSNTPSSPILFITGTDTGVGKTVATALLLHHLRATGRNALAMKPFCSGSREDVEYLQAVQGPSLTDDEVNPFYFPLPLAPLVAARRQKRRIQLEQVIARIRQVTPRCERLLIEGAGGLLAPLGEGYTFLDLIARLQGEVLVVASNKLGVINHVCLTVQALRVAGATNVSILLMAIPKPDTSAPGNLQIIPEILSPVRVFWVPFLGAKPLRIRNLHNNYKKVKKTLAALIG